ncbi:MAG TPA: cyanophycin synthetase [Rhodopseudomonas sp.]|uniref:bifunctional folylpolyglutamate synthase/dihydrofolate synthase n=1 Tax=Rhodopseudomonas sp. TaxID=1078 RepID=UPI002ED90815
MFDLPKYGEGPCLARLADLLHVLGIDRARLQRGSVVVTGSNGKGSTAAFCAAIGRAYGLKTGLFSSPHLYRFNERFQIGATPIDDATLTRLMATVSGAIAQVAQRRGERFGAFEAQFALACLWFQEAACDFAVLEAGIGGRYDPVRLVGAGVSCVASVDYEHVQLLGDSLQMIASDKTDACAAGGRVIYGENCRALRDHLAEYNRNRGVDGVYVRDEIVIGNERVAAAAQRFDLAFDEHRFQELETQLVGSFQFNNAAIAVALFVGWLRQRRPDAAPASIEAAVRAGLRDTRWGGRLELIRQQPLTVVDVGHTPDGIRQALTSLAAIHGARDWILVLGVSRDKKSDEIVQALAPAFDRIVCSSAQHKGGDPAAIAQAAHAANPRADIRIAATVAEAVRESTAWADATGGRIYVAGGLFLAIEYAQITRGGRAEELDFF